MSEVFDPFTGTYRSKAESARVACLSATRMLTKAIKTSYGALGQDKMCISQTGDVLITNDGITILKNMLLNDPIADLIIELSKQQDIEIGDGTTTIVLLANALIEKGIELIEKGLHSSIIIAGYKQAYKESIALIRDRLSVNEYNLKNITKTTISSKLIEGDHFTNLILKAVLNTAQQTENNEYFITNTVDSNNLLNQNINILKKEGGSMYDSVCLDGYAINAQPVNKNMPKMMKNARVCLLDFDLSRIRMPLNVNIVCDNPDDLEKNRKEEIEIALKNVDKILKECDVILTTRNIDDFCIKPILEAGKMAIKRVPMKDMKILSDCLNIPILKDVNGFMNDDIFNDESLNVEQNAQGSNNKAVTILDNIEVKQLCHENYTVITKNGASFSTIILRGPNEQVIDEMERAVNDGICALRKVINTKKILPGGGAIEIALSIFLEKVARNISSKESISLLSFTECLHVIPKTLAINAGMCPNETISNLILKQIHLERNGHENPHFYGLNVLTGQIGDNMEQGIVEPAILKMRIIRAAVEVAISILRIDEIIKVPVKLPRERQDPCGGQ
ncbi:Chaperonin complex component, TCP-1 alpha subunit (CCT1) [Pseudoloma neurophilia]|uniref:Chaperonin complex component, TCP-1 alpha subunit (CCT1) n=1 Tax=Pseudoloma neurophilia TaxID=146866 RepID=A0A0R0M5F5_9MICR|nr:Chaperonin complex component, TCP-1 alpha subunit (CCT1) [Pseudoloma neurophilia]